MRPLCGEDKNEWRKIDVQRFYEKGTIDEPLYFLAAKSVMLGGKVYENYAGFYSWIWDNPNFAIKNGIVVVFKKKYKMLDWYLDWFNPNFEQSLKEGRSSLKADILLEIYRSIPKKYELSYAQNTFVVKIERDPATHIGNVGVTMFTLHQEKLKKRKFVWSPDSKSIFIKLGVKS